MTNLIEIGKQIKQKRLSLNMTMDVCANKAGITRATLWAIEKGKSNCALNSFLNVLRVLDLSLFINNVDYSNRKRATRLNTLLSKKINEFLIMCIEEYASFVNKSSSDTYKTLREKGILDELKNEYDDLHGYSQDYINEYISDLLSEGK